MNNKILKTSLMITTAATTFVFLNTLNAQEAREQEPRVQIPLDMNMDVLNKDGDLDPEHLKITPKADDETNEGVKQTEDQKESQVEEEPQAEEKPWWKLW